MPREAAKEARARAKRDWTRAGSETGRAAGEAALHSARRHGWQGHVRSPESAAQRARVPKTSTHTMTYSSHRDLRRRYLLKGQSRPFEGAFTLVMLI